MWSWVTERSRLPVDSKARAENYVVKTPECTCVGSKPFYFLLAKYMLLENILNYMCTCESRVCMWVQLSSEASINITCSWLTLQAAESCVIWVLGTRLRSSVRAAHAFNCWAIFPAPADFAYSFPHMPKKHLIAPTSSEVDVQGTWAFSLSKLGIPL